MAETTYSHVILFDVDPAPNQPHVYCETMERSKIETVVNGRLKMTEALRTRPIELPIYDPPHSYYFLAKVDSDCSMLERNRARSAIQDHVMQGLRQGLSMSDLASSAVKAFPSRVIKGRNYVASNAPATRLGTSARFTPKVVSSSESDTGKKTTFIAPRNVKRKAAVSKSVAPVAQVVVEDVPTAVQDIPDLGDLLANGNVPVTLSNDDVIIANGASVTGDTAVPDPPPTIKRVHSNSNCQSNIDAISGKVDYLPKFLGEKISNLHGAVTYLSGRVDDIITAQGELKELLNSYAADNMVKNFMEKPNFPFTSADQLNEYLEADPEGRHLTER